MFAKAEKTLIQARLQNLRQKLLTGVMIAYFIIFGLVFALYQVWSQEFPILALLFFVLPIIIFIRQAITLRLYRSVFDQEESKLTLKELTRNLHTSRTVTVTEKDKQLVIELRPPMLAILKELDDFINELARISGINKITNYLDVSLGGVAAENAYSTGHREDAIMVISFKLITTLMDSGRTLSSIKGVIAHEVGHHANNDIFHRLFLNSVIDGVRSLTSYAFYAAITATVLNLFWPDPTFAMMQSNSLLTWAIGTLIGRIVLPLSRNYADRQREYLADAYAIATGHGEGLKAGLSLMASKQSPEESWILRNLAFLFDHPDINARPKLIDSLITAYEGNVPDRLEFSLWQAFRLLVVAMGAVVLLFTGNISYLTLYLLTCVWMLSTYAGFAVLDGYSAHAQPLKLNKLAIAGTLLLAVAYVLIGAWAILLSASTFGLPGVILCVVWGLTLLFGLFQKASSFMDVVHDTLQFAWIAYGLYILYLIAGSII